MYNAMLLAQWSRMYDSYAKRSFIQVEHLCLSQMTLVCMNSRILKMQGRKVSAGMITGWPP